MYKSPIELSFVENAVGNAIKQIINERDAQIYKHIETMGISVDKDELIKALAYDSRQYDEGYRDAMATIVHCKDCNWYGIDKEKGGFCMRTLELKPYDYCSYGERRCVENEQK